MSERYSVAEDAEVEIDPVRAAILETENAIRQFDAAMDELDKWLSAPSSRLKVSTILEMQRLAVEGLDSTPGTFRTAGVEIRGSNHSTPEAKDVPRLIEEMCDYVNDMWDRSTPVHLASYILWRINWIHPFRDGNGRTARIISYLVLCAKSGQRLPGTNTIPDQISKDKTPYYNALEAADNSFEKGSTDVSAMEDLINKLLADQLIEIYETVSGIGVKEDALSVTQSNDAQITRTGIIGTIERHPVIVGAIAVIGAAIIAVLL